MLLEYAVEPKAIGSSWHNYRYLIEKFGFDRGRLISLFPKKSWLREVYESAADMSALERSKLEVSLRQAKHTKFIDNKRVYSPALGDWYANALNQHSSYPFHAVIAEANPSAHNVVLIASDIDELTPLMTAHHTRLVPRTGDSLALAMQAFLQSAQTVLIVDRFFDIRSAQYRETLKACLSTVSVKGSPKVQFEIHCADHDSRPSADIIERDAGRWLNGVIPNGMSIILHFWKEKVGGEDFHARHLLTDVGGMIVESGFAAEGAHQNVELALLTPELCKSCLSSFARHAAVYELVEPVLEIFSDGIVKRV